MHRGGGGQAPPRARGRAKARRGAGRCTGGKRRRAAYGGAAGRWLGEPVVVAASGPSLTQEDLDYCRGRARLILVNAAARLWGWAPWGDVTYGADHRFWIAYHRHIVGAFRGELWTCSQGARDEFGLFWIPADVGPGLNRTGEKINSGCNSGYQALHLAALFQGFTLEQFKGSRIVLLGFDMQRTGGKSHCHGDHIKGLPNGSNFKLWLDHFGVLARDLKSTGVDVVNCTRQTAMRCFRRAPLSEALP